MKYVVEKKERKYVSYISCLIAVNRHNNIMDMSNRYDENNCSDIILAIILLMNEGRKTDDE